MQIFPIIGSQCIGMSPVMGRMARTCPVCVDKTGLGKGQAWPMCVCVLSHTETLHTTQYSSVIFVVQSSLYHYAVAFALQMAYMNP